MSKLPKDVELALRYLQEVVRSGKREVFATSSNAFFDAVLQFLGSNNNNTKSGGHNDTNNNKLASCTRMDDSRETLLKFLHDFLAWIDEQISSHLYDRLDEQARCRISASTSTSAAISAQNAKERSYTLDHGLQLLRDVELALRQGAAGGIGSSDIEQSRRATLSAKVSSARSVSRHNSQARIESKMMDAELKYIDTGQHDKEDVGNDDTIDSLIQQILNRKTERFEPRFASIARPEEDTDESTLNEDDTDSEDDSGVHVDEDRDESVNKNVDVMRDERVEGRVDDNEWHRTHVTDRTLINAQICLKALDNKPGNAKLAENAFNEFADSSSSVSLESFWKDNSAPHLLQLSIRPDTSDMEEGATTIMHSVQHASNDLQIIKKKCISNESSHRIEDTCSDVTQTTCQFADVIQSDRTGQGLYEGSTNIGCGEPSIMAVELIEMHDDSIPDDDAAQRLRCYVPKYEKKIGEDVGDTDNFFKATTLACYVTLNDNLRFYEERQRKKVDYAYASSNSGPSSATSGCAAATTPDYVNLRQLLQASTDYNGDATILLPTQFLDDTDESDVERSVNKTTVTTTIKPSPMMTTTTTTTTAITTTTTTTAKCNRMAPFVVGGIPVFRASGELNDALDASRSSSYNTQTPAPSDSILESLDVSEYLVLRAKEPFAKPTEVRGGPKTALIVYATQNCSLLYQEAFIITYRSFVTSKELIQKLIRRYMYMSAEKKATHQKAARQTFSVLVRVVHELCSLELTRELVATISSFIYRLIRSGNYEFARILRRRLMEIIEEKSLLARRVSAFSCAMPTECGGVRQPSIFDFRSSSLAKQITYLDAELLNRIEPAEMLWWAEEQDEKKSPNVVAFTEHFNRVSYWVRTQVIMQQDQRDREKYMLKFIKIMKQLRKLGNYNSYLAILSALDSGPIRRLDWSRCLRDQLAEHAEIMESSHSFKNYRTLLADTVPPCLPYIGLILQDLTFVHVGNPDYLFASKFNGEDSQEEALKINRKNLLNYGKRWQQFAILDNIRRFKTWPYDIQKDEKVLSAFNNFADFLQEEETWERSFELKARTQRQRKKMPA